MSQIPTGPNNILDDIRASLRDALGDDFYINATPTPGMEGYSNFTFTRQGSDESVELMLGLGLQSEATGERAIRVRNNQHVLSNPGGYFYNQESGQGQLYDPYSIMGLLVTSAFNRADDYRTAQEIVNEGINEGLYINQAMQTPQFLGTGPLNSPEQRAMIERGRLGMMTRGFVPSDAVIDHLSQVSGALPAHLTYLAPESGKSPAVVTPSYFGAQQLDSMRSLAPVDAQSLFKRSTLYGRREVAHGMVSNPDGTWSVAQPAGPNEQGLGIYRQSGVILPGHDAPHAGIQTQAATFNQGLAVSPGSSILDPRGINVDRWGFESPKYRMPVPINQVESLFNPAGLNFTLNNDIVGREFAPHTNVQYGTVTRGDVTTPLTFNTGARPWVATEAPYISIPQGLPNEHLTTLVRELEAANIRYDIHGGKISGQGPVIQAVMPGMGATSISLKGAGGKNVPQANVIPNVLASLGGVVEGGGTPFQVNNIRNWKSGEWSFINALAGMTPAGARGFLGEFAGSLPEEQAAIVNAGLGGEGPVNLGNIMNNFGPMQFQNQLWNFVQSGITNPETNAQWLQNYQVGLETGTLNLGYYDAAEAQVMERTMRQGAIDLAKEDPRVSRRGALSQLEKMIKWTPQDDGTVLLQQTGTFFTSPILERPVPEMLGEGRFSPTHMSSLRAAGYTTLAGQLGAEYTMDPMQAMDRSAVKPAWWHMLATNKGFGLMGRGGMQMPTTVGIDQDQMWDLMDIVSAAEEEFADLGGNQSRAVLQRVAQAWGEMAPRGTGEFRGIGLGGAMQMPDPAAVLDIDVEDELTGETIAHQSTMWLEMFKRATGASDDPSRRAVLQEYYSRQNQFISKTSLAKNFAKLTARQGLAHRYFASPQATANNVYYSDEALMSAYGQGLGIPEGTEDPYQHENFLALKDFIEGRGRFEKSGGMVGGFFARDPNLDRGPQTTIPSRLRTRDSLKGTAIDAMMNRQSVLVGSTYDAITIGDKDADQAASFFPIDISFDDKGKIQFAGTDDEVLLRDIEKFQDVDAFANFARDTNRLRFAGASEAEKRAWGGGDPFRVEMKDIISRGLGLSSGLVDKLGSRIVMNSDIDDAARRNASHQMGMGTAYNLFLRGTEAAMSEGGRFSQEEIDDAINNQMMQYQQVLDATRGQSGLEKMMSSTIFTGGRAGSGQMGLWFTHGDGQFAKKQPGSPEDYLKMLATQLHKTSMLGDKAIAYSLASGSENFQEILSGIEGLTGRSRRKALHSMVEEGTIGLEGTFPRMMLGIAARRTAGREDAAQLEGLTFGGQTLSEIQESTSNLVTGYDFIRGVGVPGLREQILGSEAFGSSDIGTRYRFMLAGMGLEPAGYDEALRDIASNELMYAGRVQQHYAGGAGVTPFTSLSVSQIAGLLEGKDEYGGTQKALLERALGDPYLPEETRNLFKGILSGQPRIDNEHIRRGNQYESSVTQTTAVREAFGLDVHTQSSQSFFLKGLDTPGGLFKLGTTGGHTDFMGFDRDDDGNITGIRFVDTKSYSDRNKIRAILGQEDHPGYHNVRMQQLMNIRGVRGQTRSTLKRMLTSFYENDPRYPDGVDEARIDQEVEALKNPDIPADPYALLDTGGGASELAPLFGSQFDRTEQEYLEQIESEYTGPGVINRIKELMTNLQTGQAGPFGLVLPGRLRGDAGFNAGQRYLEGILNDRLTSGQVDPAVRAAIARRARIMQPSGAGGPGGGGRDPIDLIPPITGGGGRDGGMRYGGYGTGYWQPRQMTPGEASEAIKRMQNVHASYTEALDAPGVTDALRAGIGGLGWGLTDDALQGDIGNLLTSVRGMAMGDPERMRQLNTILGQAGGGQLSKEARRFFSVAGGGKLDKAFKALADQDPDMDIDFLKSQHNYENMARTLEDPTATEFSASQIALNNKEGLTSEQVKKLGEYATEFEDVMKRMTKSIQDGNEATDDRVKTEKYLEADMFKRQAENLLLASSKERLSGVLSADGAAALGASGADIVDARIKAAQIDAKMMENEKAMGRTAADLDSLNAGPMRQVGQFFGGLPGRLMSGFTLMQLNRMGRIGGAAMSIGDDELFAREASLRDSMISNYGGSETPWITPQMKMDRQRYMMSSGGMQNLYNLAGDAGLGAMAGDFGGAIVGGLTAGTALGYLGAGAAAGPLGVVAGLGLLGVNMYGHASRPADSISRAAAGGVMNEAWLTGMAGLNPDLSNYLLPYQQERLEGDDAIGAAWRAASGTAYSLKYGIERWGETGEQPYWLKPELTQEQMQAPVNRLALRDSYAALGDRAIPAAGRAMAPGTDLRDIDAFARAYGVAGEEGRNAMIGFGQRMNRGISSPSQQFYAELFDPYQTTGTQRLRRQALLSSGIHSAFDPGQDMQEFDRLANLVGGNYGDEFVGMTQAVGGLMDFGIDTWKSFAESGRYSQDSWSPYDYRRNAFEMAQAQRATQTVGGLAAVSAPMDTIQALGQFHQNPMLNINALKLSQLAATRTSYGLDNAFAGIDATPGRTSFIQQQTSAAGGLIGRGLDWRAVGAAVQGTTNVADLNRMVGITGFNQSMMAIQASMDPSFLGSQVGTFQGLGIAAGMDLTFDDISTMAVEQGPSGEGLYRRGTFGFDQAGITESVFGEGWQDRPDPHGIRQTLATEGFRGLQQRARQHSLNQAGIAGAAAQLSFAFTTGVGLDKYQTVDPRSGKRFDIPAGGAWGIQERQMDLSNRQQEYNFAYQEQTQAMQSSQFYQNLGLQRDQQLTQRGWTTEDWAYQDQARNLQWGWQQEDFQESVRFMTGRERTLSERQMGRATVMHGMESERIDTQRDRQESIWEKEDQRFELTKSHHEEQMELQEERLTKMKEFYQESKKLQEESFELRKAQFIEQNRLQKAAASTFGAHMQAVMDEYKEYIEDLEAKLGLAGSGQRNGRTLAVDENGDPIAARPSAPSLTSGGTAGPTRPSAAPVSNDAWQQDLINAIGNIQVDPQPVHLTVKLQTPWGFTQKVIDIVQQELSNTKGRPSKRGRG